MADVITPLTGIVLAGGQSSRMGRDKACLPWGEGDLLNTVLAALAPVCGRLIVVSNVPRAISLAEVAVVADRYRGCGPLAGIHAGLLASGEGYSFVAACDMPYLRADAVAYMAKAAEGYDAAAPYVDGHFHPLHAVYHHRCLPAVEALLAGGRYRVVDFYDMVSLRRVSKDELASLDPELRMLRNMNSPEDLPPGYGR
ncbi:MAG: molybdenum cofactor guanylyltransferase [Sporomusaceae bacterium]|nr:molybdenum cofactor guanylyltransferase [Sporomusaceae bacterium]